MEIESSKTAVFVEAIQALAKEQCDKIDRETEELRKQRIDAMQESAKARYDAYTEYETARINAEFNREISKLTETSRGQLTQQRSEIFDRVFAAVDEKLRALCKRPLTATCFGFGEKACKCAFRRRGDFIPASGGQSV